MEQLDHAYHEAGHAVFALCLGLGFERIRLCDSGEIPDAHGCMEPDLDQLGQSGLEERELAERWAQVAISGPLAEKKFNPLSDWKQNGTTDCLDAIRKLCGSWVEPESNEARTCLDRMISVVSDRLNDPRIEDSIRKVAVKLFEHKMLTYEEVSNICKSVARTME